ncbi:hypothetical protein P4E94_16190 [Pontiellaceae bacterium B12219]|nr:hypothetical protein [Pontiellaceae bacterium B12219]
MNGTTISWATSAEQNYEIQSREMLNIGSWSYYTNMVGTPPETTFEMPVDESDTRFFRVNIQN